MTESNNNQEKDKDVSLEMESGPNKTPDKPPEKEKVNAVKDKKKGFLQRIAKTKVSDDGSFKDRLKKFAIIYLAICVSLLCVAGFHDYVTTGQIDPHYESYSVFLSGVDNQTIFGAYLSEDESKIYYQYKQDMNAELLKEDPAKVSIIKFDKEEWCYTNYVSYDNLKQKLMENDIPLVRNKFDSMLDAMLSMIISLSTTCVMFYFMYLMVSMFMKQMSINTSKYEVNQSSNYKFDDVIGHDEVITDIRQYISLLQKNDKLKDIHVKTPKGILFTGRPGTGKTLLAKAMAGEAGVPFIYLNTSNVIEMYVGVGAKTIRSCFKKARELAPCVVFLDEIDAIGGGRGSNKVGSSEDTQTLLALLQEMDGFSGSDGILIIAATNTPDSLDEALRRSGRFDREIIINAPRNADVRKQMLLHYTKHYQLGEDVNLDDFAKQLANMTGADIANICNEAAVINIMQNDGQLKILTQQNFIDALDKLMLKGNKLEDTKRINMDDRRIVAYHEAGHAVATFLCNDRISRISIQSTTSGVGGFVMGADKDSQFRNINDLYNRVKILYAGRCSEAIKFGETAITTGAVNDIEQATNILSSMFLKYGYSTDLGMLNYEMLIRNNLVDSSLVYKEIKAQSNKLMDDMMALLRENYYLVEALAPKLLECETMSGDDAEEFLTSARHTQMVSAGTLN